MVAFMAIDHPLVHCDKLQWKDLKIIQLEHSIKTL